MVQTSTNAPTAAPSVARMLNAKISPAPTHVNARPDIVVTGRCAQVRFGGLHNISHCFRYYYDETLWTEVLVLSFWSSVT